MNLNTLQIFLAVAETGNYSKAAARMLTTQSNVSKQMKALENELGVRLTERSSHGVVVTEAASYLYAGLSKLLPELNLLLEQTKVRALSGGGTLRVAVSDSMSVSYLMPLLQQFRESCPSVQLEIESLSKAALQSALGMGTLDVAFIFNTWSEEFPHFVCQPVTRTVPRIYYATKLLGGRKAADVSDFRDLPFIRITHRQPGAYDFLKELPFAPVRVIPADTVKTVQMYVSAGLACAILGSSQQLLDYTGVETFVLPDSTRRVGTDAIWNEGNDNPALFYLEKLIRKEYAASGGPERPDGDGE